MENNFYHSHNPRYGCKFRNSKEEKKNIGTTKILSSNISIIGWDAKLKLGIIDDALAKLHEISINSMPIILFVGSSLVSVHGLTCLMMGAGEVLFSKDRCRLRRSSICKAARVSDSAIRHKKTIQCQVEVKDGKAECRYCIANGKGSGNGKKGNWNWKILTGGWQNSLQRHIDFVSL